jgi:hypothetical protein
MVDSIVGLQTVAPDGVDELPPGNGVEETVRGDHQRRQVGAYPPHATHDLTDAAAGLLCPLSHFLRKLSALPYQRIDSSVDLGPKLAARRSTALKLTDDAEADGGVPESSYLPSPRIHAAQVQRSKVERTKLGQGDAQLPIGRLAAGPEVAEQLDERLLSDIL